MNRIFNEGVSSSVSRVSAVSGQFCGSACDIPNPKANKRPHKEGSAIKISFNGIFEPKPRSEGSVASDSTNSPVVSPMVALNHNRQSPTTARDYNQMEDEVRDEDNPNRVQSKRGRKRKVKEVLDPLKDKLDVRRRVHKSQTTEQLAQKFNIEVKLNDSTDSSANNRIVTTIRTNRKHNKNVGEVEVGVDDNEIQSKSELMQRFLLSQSSTTSPAIPGDNDYSYNSIGGQQVTSAASAQSCDPSVSSEHPSQQTQLQPKTSSHYPLHLIPTPKTVSSDSVGDEIKDILSHLPPLYVNDLVWSESELNDNSNDNDLNCQDNTLHNHRREGREGSSDLDSNSNNSNSNNSNNNNINNNLIINSNNITNKSSKLKEDKQEVSDYLIHKYCEQKWESVNGTYDSETDWRTWDQLTSAVSYNGDILHILPYVDIGSDRNDLSVQHSDSE